MLDVLASQSNSHGLSPRNQFLVGGLVCFLLIVIGFFAKLYFLFAVPFVLLSLPWVVKDIRILFYALLMFIPLSINLESDLDFPDEPLMICVTGVFIVLAIFQSKKQHWRTWLSNPLIFICLLSLTWLLLSVLNSTNPLLSLKFFLKKIWYLVPFLFMPLIIYRDTNLIAKSFKLLFIPMLVMVIFVLYKYSFLGFRFEVVQAPMQPFFMNHVIYGSMVSIFLPLIVGAIFYVKRYSGQWMILFVSLIIFFIANYFSYSRAAWMAMFFAMGVYVAVRFKIMQYAILFFYAIVLSGILLLAHNNNFITYKPNHDKTMMHDESIVDHIMATIKGTDISSAERYYRWIAGIRMSCDYPLLGVGPNNFYDNYKAYGLNEFHTWVSRNPERSTTHNYFLFMLVEQGYPAMILYASLIVAIFLFGQRLYHRLTDRHERIIVMSVLCMVGALFINNFFSELLETDKIGSFFYLGIAILVVLHLKQKNAIQRQ
jgi:O-antigen ligase